jgi:hypothetical protein
MSLPPGNASSDSPRPFTVEDDGIKLLAHPGPMNDYAIEAFYSAISAIQAAPARFARAGRNRLLTQ